ncbi:MAG: hypothetical protein ACYTFA_10270 [Planctomycetota bacterium]|jgi:hypothetical protein
MCLRSAVVAGVLLLTGAAYGVTPFVYSLNTGLAPEGTYYPPDGPGEVPGSVATLNVPAGTAFMTWSLTATGTGSANFRVWPEIGGNHPGSTEAVRGHVSAGPNPQYAEDVSGSWSTYTAGGEIEVRLWIDGSYDVLTGGPYNSISWTLIVFPEEPAPTPAVSAWGLAVIALAMVAAGSVLIRYRSVSSPSVAPA